MKKRNYLKLSILILLIVSGRGMAFENRGSKTSVVNSGEEGVEYRVRSYYEDADTQWSREFVGSESNDHSLYTRERNREIGQEIEWKDNRGRVRREKLEEGGTVIFTDDDVIILDKDGRENRRSRKRRGRR